MNHYEKTIKLFALTLAIFLTIPLSQAEAKPSCGEPTNIDSQAITITPELDCIQVDLAGVNCSPGSVGIKFTNNCDTKLLIEGLEERAGFTVEIEPMGIARDNISIEDDITENISYAATVGEKNAEIEISVTASVFQSGQNSGPSCSSASKGNSTFFLLLGVGLFLTRRKRK